MNNNWIYDGTIILDISQVPEDSIGFVYVITHIPSGKRYIGKKNLYSERKVPMSKRELSAWTKPGTKPKKKLVVKESNWKSYYSSNAWIIEQIRAGNADEFRRDILCWCNSKTELTYEECRWQFIYDVLRDENFINDNILGKFYKGKI